MRFLLGYSYKRLLRERIKSITVPLIAFTLVILINSLGGIRMRLENEYEYMLDNFPVIAVLSNLSGDITDELHIDIQNIDFFTNPDNPLGLYRHVNDLTLRRSISAEIAASDADVDIVGITNFTSDDMLDPEVGTIVTFFDDHDENVLQSSDLVAIVSENLLEHVVAGELSMEIPLQLPGRFRERFVPELNPGIIVVDGRFYIEDFMIEVSRATINFEQVYVEGDTTTIAATLTVIGTVTDATHNMIYTPFWALSKHLEEYADMSIYSELLRMTVAENRDLSTFKGAASLSFSRVRPIHDTRPFAMTVYDSVFYETAEPLLQNKMLVDVATPIMYGISILVGFLTSMLLTRQRKSEFATMRSVGVSRSGIATSALSEQLLLCLIGAALGFAIIGLTLQYLSITRPLIFIACYMLGAVFSVIRAVRSDVLSILRERE